mgnify:CR=1 FL=1
MNPFLFHSLCPRIAANDQSLVKYGYSAFCQAWLTAAKFITKSLLLNLLLSIIRPLDLHNEIII